MSRIDALAPARTLALGLRIAGLNPKNLVPSAAAGAAVAEQGGQAGAAVALLASYVLVGSLTVVGPVV